MKPLKQEGNYAAELGEGLLNSPKGPVWVDILGQKIVWGEKVYELDEHIPSVIFEAKHSHLLIGTHQGIFNFHDNGEMETICLLENFDSEKFRLNDGCKLTDGSYLVGSTLRQNPEMDPGRIYRIFKDGQSICYDWEVRIPNSFVQINENTVLITDSHCRTIYETSIDGPNLEPTPWYQELSGATPL